MSVTFQNDLGQERWIGVNGGTLETVISEIRDKNEGFYSRYNISDFSLSGSQADLYIDYREGVPRFHYKEKLMYVGKYYFYKFFRKDALDGFLSDLIKVTLQDNTG